MESVGLRLRSGGSVPALKSPPKASKLSSAKNASKASKKSKAGGGGASKATNLAGAMDEAQAYFEEGGMEEFGKKKKGKRGRENEEEGESLEERIIAEAELLSAKVAEKDKYLLKVESRRTKTLKGIDRYKQMATLAKSVLKGQEASKKGIEIKNKLKHLNKLLLVLQELNAKRSDDIYAAALEEVSAAKHPSKKRRTGASTLSEDSEEHDFEVSEGKHASPMIHGFSIPSPSHGDRPKSGDHPIHSDDDMSMQ
jgi:hypothetical protein